MSVAKVVPPLPADCPLSTERFQQIRQDLYTTSQTPKPTGWKDQQGWVMSTVHLFVIDMIVRVYAFAEEAVEKGDLANYLGFADMAFGQISNHHHFEEELIFPYLEKVTGRDMMNANVVQHHSFAPQLEQVWQYVRQCRLNLNPLLPPVKEVMPEVEAINLSGTDLDPEGGFDPAKLRRHMDGFVPLLAEHLYDEIATLSPGNLKTFSEEQGKEYDGMVEAHLKSYDPTWFLCSSIAMMPMKNVKDLISLPLPVRRIIVPFILSRKHAGTWPYCSHPENLTFWGSA